MNPMTRRQWCWLAAGTFAASVFAGCSRAITLCEKRGPVGNLMIGIQSYSLRDRSLENAIAAMKQLGFTSCELWHGHTEPRNMLMYPEKIREWRRSTGMEYFEGIRKQFEKAGITIQAYTVNFNDQITDDELDFVFRSVKALKTCILTTSCTVSVLGRVDHYAKRHKILVGMHNHSKTTEPNEIATPESMERGMEGKSRYIGINLDIGHFTAAGYDALDFIARFHGKIRCIHLKDRLKDQGPVMPFGEGDAPVREVLQLLKQNKWDIPVNIEYEYNAADTIEEIRKILLYCNKTLIE